jgi:hypothetical protein
MERLTGCYDEPEEEGTMDWQMRMTLEDLHAANQRIKASIARIEQNNEELRRWLKERGIGSDAKA